MLVDLHCHTAFSHDSSLPPVTAVTEAKEAGLDAIVFDEHDRLWSSGGLCALAAQQDFPVFGAVETRTELGHMLIYGLPEFNSAICEFEVLAREAHRVGAAVVLAHPCRQRRPEAGRVAPPRYVAALPHVDALETINASNRDVDNLLAANLAVRMGLPAVGGSEAHTPRAIGSAYTEIDVSVSNSFELAEAIRAGLVSAVHTSSTASGRVGADGVRHRLHPRYTGPSA